jgi:hypothetical protein
MNIATPSKEVATGRAMNGAETLISELTCFTTAAIRRDWHFWQRSAAGFS